MKNQGFHLIDHIATEVDQEMTMSDIARVIARMNDCYPSPECQRLARLLAAELGEVYLDKMCQQLMRAPFWAEKDSRK